MNVKYYISGNKKGKNCNQLELAALSDPLLAEALDGFIEVETNHIVNIHKIDKILAAKYGKKEFPVRMAFAIIIIFIFAVLLSFLIINQRNKPTEKPQVEPKTEKIQFPQEIQKQEVQIVSTDTLTAPILLEKSENPSSSQPQMGMPAYINWQKTNLKNPATCRKTGGTVTVRFRVNTFGRPSGIRIISSFCLDANREVLRLLTTGPQWTPSNTETILDITF